MGLVFKSFLIVILILLVFTLIELTFNIGFFTNFLVQNTEKLFYVFELEDNYKTAVSIIKQQNASEVFLGMTSDDLEFGVIPLGSGSNRFMNLANDDEIDYKILLIVTGNITPMVKFDSNDFNLRKGENAKITVTLDSSLAPTPGNYTGEVSVISKRPRLLFLSSFMEGS